MESGIVFKDNKMEELVKQACKAFATHYHFMLKAQNYHWNVRGVDFLQYHELFGDIYEELEDSLDAFAEHIRGLQALVPAGFEYLLEYSELEDPKSDMSKDDMVYTLYRDNAKIVKAITDAYNLSELNHEYGFSAFLTDRLAQQRKHGWQLYSSMPL
jgi:starvation-inducible DNA-binding protein